MSNVANQLILLSNQTRSTVFETEEGKVEDGLIPYFDLNAAQGFNRLVLKLKFGDEVSSSHVYQLKKHGHSVILLALLKCDGRA